MSTYKKFHHAPGGGVELGIDLGLGLGNHFVSVEQLKDGKRLAWGGQNMPIRIWDTAISKQIAALWGHTQAVLGVLPSPETEALARSSNRT